MAADKGAAEIAILNASIGLVSTVLPEVGALVLGLKTIWMAANPGKTEADWIAGLAAASGALTSAADAQLEADGFRRDPITGKWIAPPEPGAPAAAVPHTGG